jgi:hypothetical protein
VEASVLEEPGGGKPHAGICAGGVQQWASLPRLSPRRESRVVAVPVAEVPGSLGLAMQAQCLRSDSGTRYPWDSDFCCCA